jgi:tryptophanyl-tRNA synthetase
MGPGIANLLAIGQACDPALNKETVAGMRYGDFKKRVAEAVIARLEPIQRRYREITQDPAYVEGLLARGRDRVLPIAEDTVKKTKHAMGLFP